MAEGAADAVVLRVPVVGELDLRVVVAGRCQEYQREPPFFVVDAPDLAQSEQIAVEMQRPLEVADAHHRVEIFHAGHASTAAASNEGKHEAERGAPRDDPDHV